MARNPVVGRHRLYKEGTTKLISWLTKTANQYCDISSMKNLIPQEFSAPASQNAPPPDTAYAPAKVRELVRFAGAVASASPPVVIPVAILEVTRDVIDGRLSCAAWYAGQSLQESSRLGKEDRAHRHFITVLQEVHLILHTAREDQQVSTRTLAAGEDTSPIAKARSRKTSKTSASPSADATAITNLFNHLEIEEPSPTPLGTKQCPNSKEQRPKNTESEQQYDLAAADDTAFALWCFLEDLHDVRTFARETWQDFAKGEVSNLAASMVTDTAFGLMRCADEESTATHPLFVEHHSIMVYLSLSASKQGRNLGLSPAEEGGLLPQTEPDAQLADVLCPVAMNLLRTYQDCLHNCPRCPSKPMQAQNQERKPPAHPAGDGATPFTRHALHGFGSILLDLAHFAQHASYEAMCDTFRADAFIRGLDSFGETGVMRMWLVVACQTYMDIYGIVGSKPEYGLLPLWAALLKSEDSVAEFIECTQVVRDGDDAYEKLRDIGRENGRLARGWVSAGADHKDIKDYLKKHGLKSGDLPPSAPLLSMLPVYTGRVLYDVKTEMHCYSISAANDNLFILAMAHLYKAARHYGLLPAPWHDMDFVIAQQSADRPLVTKTPANAGPKALARHYQMALGVPASSFARNPSLVLPKSSKLSPKKFRLLVVTSEFGRASIERKKDDGVLGVCRDDFIEVVLQAMAARNDGSGRSAVAAKFSPTQLPATFKKSLLADEPHLNFDYLSFWVDVNLVFADLFTNALRKLPESLSRNVHSCYELVDAFLRDAADVQLRSKPLAHAAISDAARVLNDFIAKDSKKYTQPAFDQSSGRIPKALRPQFEPRWPPNE